MTIKNRVVKFVVGLAFVLALTGGGAIVADELGMDVTPQTHACEQTGTGGGGC